MKMGAWPALAPETGALCRPGRRGRRRRDQEPGARRRRSRGRRLRGAARRRRYQRRDQAGRAAAPSGSARQPDLRLGTSATKPRPSEAFKQGRQCGDDGHRQQPAGAERDGAARGARRLRRRRGALHALHDIAEPACRAAGDDRLLQHRAGEQAARDRARCRRRLRLEDLHLSGRDGCAVGLQEGRRAGEMDRRPHRKPS